MTVHLIRAMGIVMLIGGAVPSATGTCTCEVAIENNGWCELHRVGYVGSVAIRSEWLFEALDAHGHDVDLTTFHCDSCRKAIESNGFCEQHRVGFVDGQAYFSKLTHHLARGKRRQLSGIRCPACRKHATSHGWCDACGSGWVGTVEIENRQDYDELTEALRILQLAIEAAERCEHCAVAIVTDTTCPVCRITYREGEPADVERD